MKSWFARILPSSRHERPRVDLCPVCGRDPREAFTARVNDDIVYTLGLERDGLTLSRGGDSVTLKGECYSCDSAILGGWLGKHPEILPVPGRVSQL